MTGPRGSFIPQAVDTPQYIINTPFYKIVAAQMTQTIFETLVV